jgi:hypothetical protein
MELTHKNVEEVFKYCLYNDNEEHNDNNTIVEGIQLKVKFHPERLKEKESIIIDFLEQLPDDFKSTGGGGMSFLNMCMDNKDKMWTDLHQVVELLLLLGIAIDKARFAFPRDFWKNMPGGMPYIVVL